MNLNPLTNYIFEVIESKGFHAIQHSHLETITFRQICHLTTEWAEMLHHYEEMQLPDREEGHLAKLYEEGADIIIVALDLAAWHHIDLSKSQVGKRVYGDIRSLYYRIPVLVGKLGDTYRKGRVLDADVLTGIVQLVYELLGRHGTDAIEQVRRKMDQNARRPDRWGTAEVAE